MSTIIPHYIKAINLWKTLYKVGHFDLGVGQFDLGVGHFDLPTYRGEVGHFDLHKI